MRVRFNLMVIVFLVFVLSCDTESGEGYKDYFVRYYGLDGDHYGADIVVNADGSLIILGTSEFPANSGERRIYLAKTDSEGNTVWEKLLGEKAENAKDIEPIIAGTYAGGYLILSNKVIDIAGNTNIKVLRVDATGNKIDSLELNNVYLPSNFGNSLTTLVDGGFIITGNTTDTGVLAADNTLVDPVDKTDLLSLRYSESYLKDPQWLTSFGGEPEAMGVKVFEVSPTQYYFAGYSNALHSGESSATSNYDFDFWYVKLNGQGSNSAPLYSGGPLEQERMNAIAKSGLGEYFAVGSVISGSGNPRIFASRIVGNFSVVDKNDPNHFFEGEATAVAAAGANKILMVGEVMTSGGSRDIWLTKVTRDFVDEPGFPITFGAPGNDDISKAVAELPNGDIVVLGTMNLVNQNKIALIKLKSNGQF
ncbi:MAG TPA: hypothetical protein VFU05_10080 [Cyclobacteriaceae bacterium]|nr:hypothetical protein [Cyclobacteriaceae bacterium]